MTGEARIERLPALEAPGGIEADIAIVGAGACGVTLASELAGTGRRVLLVESGAAGAAPEHEALNEVEVDAGTWSAAQAEMRAAFHSVLAEHWSAERQRFGVRVRGLGGSTIAWAGKCSELDPIDLEARGWLAMSGWPISWEDLEAPYARAREMLGLAERPQGAALWGALGKRPPEPRLDGGALRDFFWEIARDPEAPGDTVRMGAVLGRLASGRVRVLTEATVTRILLSEDGARAAGLEARDLSGRRVRVRAPVCVLAASCIENARLLLASRGRHAAGIGNAEDMVGRCLMDHPVAELGRYGPDHAQAVTARFGFFTGRIGARRHLFMHGLALSEAVQRAEGLHNGAVYMAEERALDDPFSAAGRLLRRRSEAPMRDLGFVLASPGRVMRGLGARALQHPRVPRAVSGAVIDAVLRAMPNAAVNEFRFGKLPYKFTGARVEGVTEQAPDPENRVTLSGRADALGQPLPRVRWRVGAAERAALLRQAELLEGALARAGLPAFEPAPWVRDRRPEEAVAIDLGHTLGATRMSASPRRGVVDARQQVHGVRGLYVAGGSVFPTSGHTNPTLTMMALTVRLARLLARETAPGLPARAA